MAAEHGGQQHDGANSSSMRESNEPVIKSTDMPEQMQQHAVQAALKAQAQAKEEGADTRAHTHTDRQSRPAIATTSTMDGNRRGHCVTTPSGAHAQSGGRRAPQSAWSLCPVAAVESRRGKFADSSPVADRTTCATAR